MIIVIDEYIDATGETIQRTIENVVDIESFAAGPDARINIILTDKSEEEIDVTSNFKVTRFTDTGVLIDSEGE